MAALHRQAPNRNLDMMLLTVGANDVNFAGLVANVIVDATTERILLKEGGAIASVADSQKALDNDLPDEFSQLRTALKPYVGGNLERVVFVSYANPAMQAEGKPCTGSRDGLDVHPAFGADTERLRTTTEFVDTKFLPKIKTLATCDGNKICHDPTTERMTFVDGHQAAFDRHGMCVRATSDPEFDRNCFSTSGDSFQTDPNDRARQSDGLRRAAEQLSALCAARPLDQDRQRQLFHRHDLSGRHARGVKAKRHPRCALGYRQRRLWRRGASQRRRLCGNGGRGAARRARPARLDAAACRAIRTVAAADRCRHACNRACTDGRSASAFAGADRGRGAADGRRNQAAARVPAPRRASSAGSSTTWCIGTPAASPDKCSGAPSAPSARLRGSRKE